MLEAARRIQRFTAGYDQDRCFLRRNGPFAYAIAWANGAPCLVIRNPLSVIRKRQVLPGWTLPLEQIFVFIRSLSDVVLAKLKASDSLRKGRETKSEAR
jgi:hypothetical protein